MDTSRKLTTAPIKISGKSAEPYNLWCVHKNIPKSSTLIKKQANKLLKHLMFEITYHFLHGVTYILCLWKNVSALHCTAVICCSSTYFSLVLSWGCISFWLISQSSFYDFICIFLLSLLFKNKPHYNCMQRQLTCYWLFWLGKA